MNPVEIGKVYRHFKGNYYFVEMWLVIRKQKKEW